MLRLRRTWFVCERCWRFRAPPLPSSFSARPRQARALLPRRLRELGPHPFLEAPQRVLLVWMGELTPVTRHRARSFELGKTSRPRFESFPCRGKATKWNFGSPLGLGPAQLLQAARSSRLTLSEVLREALVVRLQPMQPRVCTFDKCWRGARAQLGRRVLRRSVRPTPVSPHRLRGKLLWRQVDILLERV